MEYVCIADSVGLQGRSVSCSHHHRMLTECTLHPGVSAGLSLHYVLKLALYGALDIVIMQSFFIAEMQSTVAKLRLILNAFF